MLGGRRSEAWHRGVNAVRSGREREFGMSLFSSERDCSAEQEQLLYSFDCYLAEDRDASGKEYTGTSSKSLDLQIPSMTTVVK